MQDWSLDDAMRTANGLTKDMWTYYKYQLHRGNLTREIDAQIRHLIFGKDVPFSIVKNDDRSSVDIERERLRNFIVQMDLLRSFKYHDYINYMSNMDAHEYALPKDKQTNIRGLKSLSKSARISEDSLVKQLLYQAVYDTTFRFTTNDERDYFVSDYFDQYVVNDLAERVSFPVPKTTKRALRLFASRISPRLKSALTEFSMDMPVTSGKHSPMGLKYKDQAFMVDWIVNEKVWTGVQHNVQLRTSAMKALCMDTSLLDGIQWTDDFNEESLMMFCPKVNGIESTEFKPRIVYQSNDLDDIILDPFMRFLRLCESFCQCSFSTFKPNDERLNAKYSVARMVSEKALDLLHCGESNSDLTMATDKLSGDLQAEMILYFIDHLDNDVQNIMISLGLTIEYFKAALNIINHSMIYTVLHNRKIITGYPKAGQSQGERGSFHSLHFQNMMFGLDAFLQNGKTYDEWEKTSIYQGDDGDVPDSIQPAYIRLWIESSLPGIGSLEKTSSEASEGALLFCKTYIKTGKVSPRIVNGLKFNQFMRIFNDPQQLNDFVSFDIFQDRLIGRLRAFARVIRNKYKNWNILPNYVETVYDIGTRNRMRHWLTAKNFVMYHTTRAISYANLNSEVLYEARIGLFQGSSPYDRAKILNVRNQFLKFDIYLGAISLQRFANITEDATLENPLRDIESFFSDYRDDYVLRGIIPDADYRVSQEIWDNTKMILLCAGIPFGSYDRDDVTKQLQSLYTLSFSGYSPDHIVHIRFQIGE